MEFKKTIFIVKEITVNQETMSTVKQNCRFTKFVIFWLTKNLLQTLSFQGLRTVKGWVQILPRSVPQSIYAKLKTQIIKHEGEKKNGSSFIGKSQDAVKA